MADGNEILKDIQQMLRPPPPPEGIRQITYADKVEVRADPNVQPGEIFVLDPAAVDDWYLFDGDQNPPVMVLCHPDIEGKVAKLVSSIRGGR